MGETIEFRNGRGADELHYEDIAICVNCNCAYSTFTGEVRNRESQVRTLPFACKA